MKNISCNLYCFICITLIFISCSNSSENNTKIIAKIGKSRLLESDLEQKGLSMDSSAIMQNYISTWVKEQLFLELALGLSNDQLGVNIEHLVKEYKKNLLTAHYKKYLIETSLDTNISDVELKSYYTDHLEEFKLDHKIVQCRLVKVDKSKDDRHKNSLLIKSDNEEDQLELQKYCNDVADFCLLPFDKWYSWKEINVNFPKGIHLNKRDIGQSVRIEKKNEVFYFYLLDYLSYKDEAPLTYVRSQAKKSILYHRTQKIIDDKKEELYNKAIKDNRIKIF